MLQRFALLFALIFCTSLSLFAQRSFRIAPGVVIGDTLQLHELIMVNYSSLLGNCVELDEDYIKFKLRDADEITVVPVKDVRYLDLYFDGENGEEIISRRRRAYQWGETIAFSDPTYHRTSLPWKGKGQVRIINIVYGVAEFNLNKNFQLGIGSSLLFGLLSTQRLRFGLNDNFHFGISNQTLFPIIADMETTVLVGDVGANITLGNSDRWLSLGGGFIYVTDDDLRPTHINLSMGGKIGDKWHLYGELSVVDDRFDVLIFPAFSVAQTIRRHRWRYGFFNVLSPFNETPVIPIPLVGYEYHW